MNELEKPAGNAVDTNRLNVLAGEIKLINQQTCDAIQQIAAHGAIEIGKRLCEAKKLVAHGEWGKWLAANVSYSQDTASRFMNVYKGYVINGNSAPVRNLNFMQAVALLGIKDASERETFMSEKHEVTGKNGETVEKSVEDMSKREIEKAVKEWKDKAEKAERERDEAKEEAKREKRDRLNARYDTVPQAKELLDANEFLEDQYSRAKDDNEELRSRALLAEKKLETKEAELKATKGVLRATETKLDDKDRQIGDLVKEVQGMKEEQAHHYEDKAYNDAIKDNLRMKDMVSAAAQERDDAKAEAASLREQIDSIIAERDSFRETIRKKDEELLNRPQVETVVTKEVEVIPDEYKKAFLENQKMRKELATYKAHSQGQTLQELAQTDKEYADLEKSYDEEEKTSERLNYFKMLPALFPDGPIEARELVRCFMKFHGHEDAIVHSVVKNVHRAVESLKWIDEALQKQTIVEGQKPKLEVVK